MKPYILKTKSGRRVVVAANSEEEAKRDFLKPREITIPWTREVSSIPGGEPVERIAPLGIMLSGNVDASMLKK
jgi:hypothetical protein